MKEFDEQDERLFEAWSEGRCDETDDRRLEGDPALAEAARLQARIDAALRRRFTPPDLADVTRLVEEASEAPREAAAASGSLLDWWPLAGIAAACLALLLHQVREVDPGPPDPPGTEHFAGGLVPVTEPIYPGIVDSPDLRLLYSEIAAASLEPTESETRCDPVEWSDDEGLADALARRFGRRPKLRSGASHRLQGPFPTTQWPTGTVLAGFPQGGSVGGDRRPAVLVAERIEFHRCCVELREPEGGELHVFTWRVEGLVLFEITPHAEPQLLEFFEE